MNNILMLTVGPKEPNNHIFGQILNVIRISKKLSRVEASDRLGVTSEYIRLIERGERVPPLGTTIRILEKYGVSYTQTKNRLFFENASVKFTSRIKESRHKLPEISREELIGQIICKLVVADNNTLKRIHSKLLRESNAS